jgi:hypothetical protein
MWDIWYSHQHLYQGRVVGAETLSVWMSDDRFIAGLPRPMGELNRAARVSK